MSIADGAVPWLAAAAVLYAAAFLYALWRAFRHNDAPQILFYLFLGTGFAAQSVGLYLRGLSTHALPLANAFEILQAIAWFCVLIELGLRFFYHVRLLRLFASGFAATVCVVSWFVADEAAPATQAMASGDPWLGLHVGLAIFGYAVFTVVALLGAMYLTQQRSLERKRAEAIFRMLPPLRVLDRLASLLLPIGLCVVGLSLALGFSYWARLPGGEGVSLLKLLSVSLVWLGFLAVFCLRRLSKISGKTAARACVILFVLALASLWPVNRDREAHRPRAEETIRP